MSDSPARDAAPAAQIEIVNHAEARRWEARSAGKVLGYSEYREVPGRIVFTHTLVEPEHEGGGIGSRLARAALDDAVARELRITPICPFIRSYVERHDTYADAVDMPSAAKGA